MFSSRVPNELAPNRLSEALTARRAAGRPFLDLTSTNPTTVGFDYPPDLLHALADDRGRTYQPEPFGLPAARRAVAADYARRGISVAEERVVLTASTSDAYTVLFKLLCEPGDDVAVPVPSYPLFDHLTRLDAVGTRSYPLHYHGRWELDPDGLDAAWSAGTRAVLVVSPNNPTGSTLTVAEWQMVAERCAARDAALIVDEVFADYALGGDVEGATAASSPSEALTFRLGGLSKSAGLPQVKLGWIAVDGPAATVSAALHRLELICDTYLSVSTPVQVAAPVLIEQGAVVRSQIRERIRANYATLREAAAAYPAVEVLHADGGWSAVLRVPAGRPEEEIVLGLLEERDTLVHPGFFFDFPHEAFLVFSLLPPVDRFREGVARVMGYVGG
jgi:aspartate/methionine/tyrosine aminotransferase